MRLLPSEVVVVVHLVHNLRAKQVRHALTNPVAPGVCVAPCQQHTSPVVLSFLRLHRKQHRRRHHSAVAGRSRDLKEVRGNAVAKAATTKVDADPHLVGLIPKQVHVVIARTDRSQLVSRLVANARLIQVSNVLPRAIVKQLMVDRFLIAQTDSERDRVPNLVHDPLNVVLDVRKRQIQPNRLVAAGDVKPNACRADVVAVSHHATDRHVVTHVPIRAKHRRLGVLIARTALHLNQRVFLVIPKDQKVFHSVSPF